LARLKFRKYFKNAESEEFAEKPIISKAIKINPVMYFKPIGKNDFSVSLFNNVVIFNNLQYKKRGMKPSLFYIYLFMIW